MQQSQAKLKYNALFAVVLLLASGCGYQFGAAGTALPPNAKTIYVETFTNHTRFTGINDDFMRYLKDEIANRDRLTLVDSPGDADLLLRGEIFRLEPLPGATNAVGEPINYTESLTAGASLIDQHTHQVIWSSNGVSAASRIPVVNSAVITTSPQFLQQNLRAQDTANLPDIQLANTQTVADQDQMMQQLAENLYTSMSEGF